ncbi:hypothetical protein BKA70DRAFT_1395413 [Coprinopsis sp. MPI-PUGE-AT-0042]|nr:hypothetical protein BKA70DRAFT_1395413 [Coprinopsis sp. MPI-PUGE-AT-0042]
MNCALTGVSATSDTTQREAGRIVDMQANSIRVKPVFIPNPFRSKSNQVKSDYHYRLFHTLLPFMDLLQIYGALYCPILHTESSTDAWPAHAIPEQGDMSQSEVGTKFLNRLRISKHIEVTSSVASGQTLATLNASKRFAAIPFQVLAFSRQSTIAGMWGERERLKGIMFTWMGYPPPKHPMTWKTSVVRRPALSQQKAIDLDVETREQEISATELLDSCSSWVSVRSCGGIFSPGSDRLLQLAGTESSSAILRECSALGRLRQVRSLVPACPSAIPVWRNQVDAESVARLDSDCPPLLECLGTGGVFTRLFETSSIFSPPLGTDANPRVGAFIKAHGHKLVIVKADLSLRGLFSAMCSNASTLIIDDDGSRNSVQWAG